MYLGIAAPVAAHVKSIYQQLHELTTLLKSFLGILLNLRYTLSERQKPSLGTLPTLRPSHLPLFIQVLTGCAPS